MKMHWILRFHLSLAWLLAVGLLPVRANRPPEVRLALAERAIWFTPGVVPLKALASDSDGYVATVEFFADRRSLGVVTNACPWCKIFPHVFDLAWTNPPVGSPEIGAVARDDRGAETQAASIRILVRPAEGVELPVVTVQTVDAEALEAARDPLTFRFDPAWLGVFRISRTGSLGRDSTVFFTLGGSAKRGVDYDLHPEGLGPCEFPCRRLDIFLEGNSVVIPAGQASTEILVRGLPDSLAEGRESVVLQLVEDPTAGPIPRYLIEAPATAELAVLDSPDSLEVVITKPANGAQFELLSDIAIEVSTRDPQGYFPVVEFFADGAKLGESQVNFLREPAPGTPIVHSWVWVQPLAGTHRLTVVGTGSDGKRQPGAFPVTLTVRPVLDLRLRVFVPDGGQAQFVLPEGSLAGHGFDLQESFDLAVWCRLGPFLPGNVAAFFTHQFDPNDLRPRFYRAVPAAEP